MTEVLFVHGTGVREPRFTELFTRFTDTLREHAPSVRTTPYYWGTELGSRLAAETPATDIQQACGTGLQAAIQVADKVALGQIEVGIAGGTDTTSDAPVAISEKLRKKLMRVNAARDTAGKVKALGAIRPGDIELLHAEAAPQAQVGGQLPSLADAERTHISRVLDAVRWNKKQAAEILQISRGTLYRKILEYGLDPGAKRSA